MSATTRGLARLLSDREVSVVTGAARSTLAKMRLRGIGPPWVRIGVSVRYPEDALRDWMKSLPRTGGASSQR